METKIPKFPLFIFRTEAMDPFDNHGVNTFNERVTIDFQYFIQSAVQKKLAWNTLIRGQAPDSEGGE